MLFCMSHLEYILTPEHVKPNISIAIHSQLEHLKAHITILDTDDIKPRKRGFRESWKEKQGMYSHASDYNKLYILQFFTLIIAM